MNMFAGNLQSPAPVNPQQYQSYNNLTGAIATPGGPQSYAPLGQQYMPYATNTFQNIYNNPYSGSALSGAEGAAMFGQQAAPFNFGGGMQSAAAGINLLPWSQAIMQTGFDPQGALYGRTLQQVQDQTRAGEAARGVATSPYGAGLENQAVSNFNIDWQNNLLNRQAQAAGAAGGLTGAGVGAINTGANIMNAVPQNLYSSSMLPYATWSGIGQGQNQALMNLLGYGGAGQNIANVPVQDWAAALSGANQMQQLQNQNFANQIAQSQIGWNQLGQLGSGIGSMFGALGPFGGGQFGGGAFASGGAFGSPTSWFSKG
jgi:hypothetical protein